MKMDQKVGHPHDEHEATLSRVGWFHHRIVLYFYVSYDLTIVAVIIVFFGTRFVCNRIAWHGSCAMVRGNR